MRRRGWTSRWARRLLASVVGLGESAHGAAEELTLKHRTLRLLLAVVDLDQRAGRDQEDDGDDVHGYALLIGGMPHSASAA